MKEKIGKFWNTPITGSQLYFIVFVLFLFHKFVDTTTIDYQPLISTLHLVSYLVIPAMLFKIYFMDHYKLDKLLWISVAIAIFLISYLKTREITILSYFLMIVGAKGVDFRKIIQWFFYLSVSFLIIIVVFTLLGVITNLIYRPIGRSIRYSLGIVYPTDFAAHVLFSILAYYYLRFGKIKWIEHIIVIAIGILVMKITNARLDSLTIFLSVPITIIAQLSIKYHELSLVTAFMWIVTPVLEWVAVVSSYFYTPKIGILKSIDDALSGRLFYSHIAFEKYPITIFGQKVIEHGNGGQNGMKVFNNTGPHSYFYIDSSYLRMFIIFGLLVFFIVSVIMIATSIKGYLNHDYIIPAIILIVSIASLVEQHLWEIAYDPFLIYLVASIPLKEKENELQFKEYLSSSN